MQYVNSRHYFNITDFVKFENALIFLQFFHFLYWYNEFIAGSQVREKQSVHQLTDEKI